MPGKHRSPGRRSARVTRTDSPGDDGLVISDAMGPFCGIGCIMFGLVSLSQFAVDTNPGSWASSTLAAVSAVILGVAWLLLRAGRGDVLHHHPLHGAVAITVLVALGPLVYIIGTGITYPATGLLLVIVGVGALLTNRFWATAVILTVNVAWVLCAAAYGLPVPPAVFAAQLAKANALAIVLAVARSRTVRRMEQARRQIRNIAVTDELTGLVNHRGLLQSAPLLRQGDRSRRSDLAVVYIDVDGLKAVNDRAGHLAGDELLRSVAHVLRQSFRSSDIIARVGGDEFAVLLVGADPWVTAQIIDRPHQQLTQVGISASTGTAVAATTAAQSITGSLDAEIADLLNEADHAMYATKTG